MLWSKDSKPQNYSAASGILKLKYPFLVLPLLQTLFWYFTFRAPL